MHIQQSVAPSHDQTQDSSDGQVHHFPSMLNTGASQGCLLSHTHLTALPDIRKNSTVTHVHNTAIIGPITANQFLSGGENQPSCKAVRREEFTAQHQQNHKANC